MCIPLCAVLEVLLTQHECAWPALSGHLPWTIALWIWPPLRLSYISPAPAMVTAWELFAQACLCVSLCDERCQGKVPV